MKKYHIYGNYRVVRPIGIFEANSPEEASELAERSEDFMPSTFIWDEEINDSCARLLRMEITGFLYSEILDHSNA